MAAHPQPSPLDWTVTDEKVAEAIRRIIAHADPLKIIAFGSRARGDHRPDSDLDLAVILDAPQSEVYERLPYSVIYAVDLQIDMIVASREQYEEFRPWMNSVFNYIDQEGIILYDKQHPEYGGPDALRLGSRRRVSPAASAA